MPETSYLLGAVLVSAGITWALRALPFAALVPLRNSAAVAFLAERMPVGVMIILVVYTLRDMTSAALPVAAAALAVTIGLHLWRRNALLSIFAGTALHIALTTCLG